MHLACMSGRTVKMRWFFGALAYYSEIDAGGDPPGQRTLGGGVKDTYIFVRYMVKCRIICDNI